jgi:hypothetical protein
LQPSRYLDYPQQKPPLLAGRGQIARLQHAEDRDRPQGLLSVTLLHQQFLLRRDDNLALADCG